MSKNLVCIHPDPSTLVIASFTPLSQTDKPNQILKMDASVTCSEPNISNNRHTFIVCGSRNDRTPIAIQQYRGWYRMGAKYQAVKASQLLKAINDFDYRPSDIGEHLHMFKVIGPSVNRAIAALIDIIDRLSGPLTNANFVRDYFGSQDTDIIHIFNVHNAVFVIGGKDLNSQQNLTLTFDVDSFVDDNADLFLAYNDMVVDYNTMKATTTPMNKMTYVTHIPSDLEEFTEYGLVQGFKNYMTDNVSDGLLPTEFEKTVLLYSYDDVILTTENHINMTDVSFSTQGFTTSLFFSFDDETTEIQDLLVLNIKFKYNSQDPNLPDKHFKLTSGADWQQSVRQLVIDEWTRVCNMKIDEAVTRCDDILDMITSLKNHLTN